MIITGAQVTEWVGSFFWPFVRVAALLMITPVFSTRMVPVRIRLTIALALTWVIAPVIGPLPAVDLLSGAAIAIVVQQFIIGLAMGFMLQLVFNALIIAGQSVSMGMGLGFASVVDPQNGINVTVLGQHFLMTAMLVFLAFNGHLVVIQVLADSFHTLPIAADGLTRTDFWLLVNFASRMFVGALLIALPAMGAVLLVNLAFGMMMRAAPQLNIFAVGFPVTMLVGFVMVILSLPALGAGLQAMVVDAMDVVSRMVTPGN